MTRKLEPLLPLLFALAFIALLILGVLWLRHVMPCWMLTFKTLPADRVGECTGIAP